MASPHLRLLADLEAEGQLPPAQAAAIAADERTRPFSLHYELRDSYLGLRHHDRLALTAGVLAVAFSIFTLRYYRALLPPEVAATLAGLVLISLSLAALRYLGTPRHGLTAAPADEATPHLNLESLVMAQTAHVPAAPTETGFQFGGGQSGGGGAESQF